MILLIITQGKYGNRIAGHIQNRAPEDWMVHSWEISNIVEPIVEEPENYLPAELPPVDLILHLGEQAQAAQLLPDLVKRTGAQGVIASIDNSGWVPQGLRIQLKREIARKGVTIVFPEPLCSLDEEKVGFYEYTQEPYTSDVISNFARYFGFPFLEVDVDEEGYIKNAFAKRGSPCGSTIYTLNRIIGMEAKKSVPSAGLKCLHYPCLASMQLERGEHGVDTIMHTSGRVFNEALQKALEKQGIKVQIEEEGLAEDVEDESEGN